MNLEEAIVHLVRLGLKGDVASVGQYSKRLLRDLAKRGDSSPKFREALAALVASAPTTMARFVEPIATEGDTGLLTAEPPGDTEVPVLDRAAMAQVEDLLREHDCAADLEAAGLHPTRTVLFTGPPGVGKTITARWIASRLGVPMFRLDLSSLMSSYLGKSGQNLRAALLQAQSVPSVLLLDEFDAIGKRRDDPADVGELKRIVNILLLELEGWPAGSLLVAATNHPELLDRALWRRFERIVRFSHPTDEARREIVSRQLQRHGRAPTDKALDVCVLSTNGASGSDITAFVRSVIKRSVLSPDTDFEQVLAESALERLGGLAREDAHARRLFCELCSRELGMTQREIAAQLGISHVAVGKLLRGTRIGEMRSRKVTGNTNHA